jgi:hypothetical protein
MAAFEGHFEAYKIKKDEIRVGIEMERCDFIYSMKL